MYVELREATPQAILVPPDQLPEVRYTSAPIQLTEGISSLK